MLTLPDAIVALLVPFATLFTSPTWRKAQLLLVGAILTPGQRTVAAALRVMGRSDQRDYARYHEVLNRAVWSSRQAARILLVLLLQHLDGGDGPLIFGIDETLERRRGAKIRARAIYRDPVRSSRSQVVKASGLRWISLMWLGHVPWAGRHWALPVLTVLAPSTRYYQQQGRQHKKLTDWARQMVMQLRRWLPHRPLVLVGDNSYAGNCSDLRGSEQLAAGGEGVQASCAPGAEDRCQRHLALGTTFRPGAPADLAADNQMAQAALGGVVVRRHVRFGHEDEEFLDVALNAPAQPALQS